MEKDDKWLKEKTRGKLIVVEALDGAGKDTQIELLIKALEEKGVDVVMATNITQSHIGRGIRGMLQDTDWIVNDIQLGCLYLSELFYVANNIKKLLEQGKWVVCSRWYYSTLAYAGNDLTDYLTIKKIAEQLAVVPDYLLFFNLDAKTAMERINYRNEAKEYYETEDKLTKIGKRYEAVLDMVRYSKDETEVIKIDASKSIEDVHKDVMSNFRIPTDDYLNKWEAEIVDGAYTTYCRYGGTEYSLHLKCPKCLDNDLVAELGCGYSENRVECSCGNATVSSEINLDFISDWIVKMEKKDG